MQINYTVKIGPKLNERLYIQLQICFLKLRLGLRTRLYYGAYIKKGDALANSSRVCSDCFALADFAWLGESKFLYRETLARLVRRLALPKEKGDHLLAEPSFFPQSR